MTVARPSRPPCLLLSRSGSRRATQRAEVDAPSLEGWRPALRRFGGHVRGHRARPSRLVATVIIDDSAEVLPGPADGIRFPGPGELHVRVRVDGLQGVQVAEVERLQLFTARPIKTGALILISPTYCSSRARKVSGSSSSLSTSTTTASSRGFRLAKPRSLAGSWSRRPRSCGAAGWSAGRRVPLP